MLSQKMDMLMIEDIAEKMAFRMGRFTESWDFALKVILLGYGDQYRMAYCISGDWEGPKHQLAADDQFPVCPKCGKVCTEDEKGPHLELVPG